MVAFSRLCGLAFVGTMLLATGGAHVAALGGFRRLLREHGVLPGRLTALLAVLVTGTELTVGLAALMTLTGGEPRLDTAVLAAAVGVGGAFAAYIRRLVRTGHTGSCGCSPLASPLTAASFVPAASLMTAGAAGLLAGWAAAGGPDPSQGESSLAIGWGLTLAALVLLVPASAPRTVTETRQ